MVFNKELYFVVQVDRADLYAPVFVKDVNNILKLKMDENNIKRRLLHQQLKHE